MEWSRSAESRGVQGKPHRKIIRDDKKKRIQAGIASDDEGDDEVVVFSEKEEAAMAKIFDKEDEIIVQMYHNSLRIKGSNTFIIYEMDQLEAGQPASILIEHIGDDLVSPDYG
uniref:Uncharacterized protein n=2 Tax=Oryza TaxID=4527 RepID=Q10Q96_ORYSJ|nr:hypothetical protein LOC_Os03g10710 [Oryza sativa Japonica Group]